MLTRYALFASTMVLTGCLHHGAAGHSHRAKAAPPEPAEATANMLGADGRDIGRATLVQGPSGVLIRIDVMAGALTPGWHGVHLHEAGDCSDTGAYKLSGAHHGKVEGGHGLLNPAGPEAGDLPNLWVSADGGAGYEAFSALFALAPSLDADGLAIIVHAQADDHLTQPIGGAGARVACGVVGRTDK